MHFTRSVSLLVRRVEFIFVTEKIMPLQEHLSSTTPASFLLVYSSPRGHQQRKNIFCVCFVRLKFLLAKYFDWRGIKFHYSNHVSHFKSYHHNHSFFSRCRCLIKPKSPFPEVTSAHANYRESMRCCLSESCSQLRRHQHTSSAHERWFISRVSGENVSCSVNFLRRWTRWTWFRLVFQSAAGATFFARSPEAFYPVDACKHSSTVIQLVINLINYFAVCSVVLSPISI